MKNFLTFIQEQGVVGLAIGFILGGAVSKVVSALVNDLINPLIGLVAGSAEGLRESAFTIGETSLKWGDFVVTVIDFLIIAAVVYYIFKGLGFDKLDKKNA